VLVTGATGFLGHKTALRFFKEGFSVTGMGRNKKIGEELQSQGVSFVCVDLENSTDVENALGGFDAVIHCGALSSPWGAYKDFYQANVIGTKNIVEACLKQKVRRLVHVSTPTLYVDTKDRLQVKESDPLPKSGINDYAKTKKMAEALIKEGSIKGLETLIIRPQGIVGPGDTSILPRLIRVAQKGTLPVIGQGENWIDLTYVDNVVQALFLAYQAPKEALGFEYNITNDEPVRLYEMLDVIFEELGFKYRKKKIPLGSALRMASGLEFIYRGLSLKKEPLITKYGVCVLGLSRTLDISLAKEKLNYRPIVSMKQAIKEIIQDYRKTSSMEAKAPLGMEI
jgi:nucleoside-diphosphate-sugar epimerase